MVQWLRYLSAALFLFVVYSMACIAPSPEFLDRTTNGEQRKGQCSHAGDISSNSVSKESNGGECQAENCQYQCTLFFCTNIRPLIASWFRDLKVTDLILAMATVVLAIYTVKLWTATAGLFALGAEQSRDIKASIKLARDEFNASHRARVRVRHFNIGFPNTASRFSPAFHFAWSFNLTNIGDVKITKVVFTYSYRWCDDASDLLAQFLESSETKISERELAPGLSVKIETPHVPINDAGRLARMANARFFMVVGRILYRGVDGIDRVTGFCRQCPRADSSIHVREFEVVKGVDYDYED